MSETNPANYPMSWHRFLCRFLLWASALTRLLQSAWACLGGTYQGSATQAAVYAALPALQYVDYAWIACMLVSATLTVLAAICLGKVCKRGLTFLMWGWLLAAGGTLLRMLLRCAISGLLPLNVSEITQVLLHILLSVVCAVYYRRRPGLFDDAQEASAYEK